jgi:hypothetical protein
MIKIIFKSIIYLKILFMFDYLIKKIYYLYLKILKEEKFIKYEKSMYIYNQLGLVFILNFLLCISFFLIAFLLY